MFLFFERGCAGPVCAYEKRGISEVEVYFDHFKVGLVKSHVIQTENFYPFGMTFNSYSRENSVPNIYLYNGKEKQDELDLGWFDYGARMYMSEIGRWTAIDLKSEKYFYTAPYVYALNNPIFFIDPDGQDAIGSVNGNTITIKSVVYIQGHNATAAKAASIQKAIMKDWGKSFTYKDGDKTYQVKFDVQVMVAGKDKDTKSELSSGENLTTLVDESSKEWVSNTSGKTGEWGEDEDDKTYSHEFGHLLSVDDLYYYDNEGNIQNYEGVDDDDNMGKNALDSKSKVNGKTIEEMVAYVLKNKGKDNTVVINVGNMDKTNTNIREEKKLKKRK